jgi:DNA repair photolyase
LRFKALEKLAAAGLRTGVSLGPIIPGLNDSDIPALLARAKAAGAAFAFYVMLRLPGATREVFLERIRARLPERAGKIEHHVREVRGGGLYETRWGARMSGTGTMAEMVDKLFRIHARKHGLEAGESLERLELRAAAQAGTAARKPEVRREDASGPGGASRAARPAGGRPARTDPGQLDLFAA